MRRPGTDAPPAGCLGQHRGEPPILAAREARGRGEPPRTSLRRTAPAGTTGRSRRGATPTARSSPGGRRTPRGAAEGRELARAPSSGPRGGTAPRRDPTSAALSLPPRAPSGHPRQFRRVGPGPPKAGVTGQLVVDGRRLGSGRPSSAARTSASARLTSRACAVPCGGARRRGRGPARTRRAGSPGVRAGLGRLRR